ncbi:hypothetical protein [Lentilitoribacter sp. Alg239-R112]|uniref:PDC sensor domain-containing protein n=1 Tax=Lentilitoribacter sp. Alg239-R112 TaxID=2305987 RepID=UPI0013A6D73A|nr:hypothetical protein [Lentilitoribacter sp. Alg239-R112]
MDKSEIIVRAQLMDAHLSKALGKGRLALIGLSDLLSRSILTDDNLHLLLKRKVKETGHIRSILFIDKDGKISADSSREEAIPLDLSDRGYFKKAKLGKSNEMQIGGILAGRTSGFPFIPLTMPVYSGKNFLGVLAAVLTPEELLLLDRSTRCELCVSIVSKNNGAMLEQYPEVIGLEDFVKSFANNQRSSFGYVIMNTGDLDAKVAWVTNEYFPIRSIYLEFIQK